MDKPEYTPEALAALRSEYAPNATDAQFTLWIEHCQRRNLVPVQDVILQVRTNKEWDPEVRAKVEKKKVIFITTIGGLRKIAERTGLYEGPLPTEWVYLDSAQKPTVYSKVPMPPETGSNPRIKFAVPWAAIAYIRRKGWPEPIQSVARFDAYAQTYKDGEAVKLTAMWATRGPEQLEKCTKAGTFREAFPETHGLYIEEEVGSSSDTEVLAPAAPVAKAPAPTVAPAEVNQTPAQPTDTPKPESKPKARAKKEEKPPVAEAPAPEPAKASPEFEKKMADLKTEMKEKYKAEDAQETDDAPTPGKGPAPKAEAEPDRLPTLEEKKKYGGHLKTFPVDNAALKTWILQYTHAESIQAMTNNQYKAVIEKLDKVSELGKAALDSLLGSAQKGVE